MDCSPIKFLCLKAGANFLYLRNTNYLEVFGGLENIFKVFRLDVVSGYENGVHTRTALRLGVNGILGNAINLGRGNSNRGDDAVGF